MVSHLFFYQLTLIALVWLCLMLQWMWPSASAGSCTHGLRIMFRDLSRSVCRVEISQSTILTTHFQRSFRAS